MQEGTAALTVALQESLAGIRVVKAFARERQQTQTFARTADTLSREYLKVASTEALNLPFLTLLLGLAMALTLYVGGRQVIAGAMSLGTLVAATGYLAQLAQPLRRLSWLTGMASLCQAGASACSRCLTKPRPCRSTRTPAPCRISREVCFTQVSFQYRANVPVLHDISFTARPGQVIALLGSTGSGKSTIAQLLPRFYDVTSGSITLDGMDLRELATAGLAAAYRHCHARDLFVLNDHSGQYCLRP